MSTRLLRTTPGFSAFHGLKEPGQCHTHELCSVPYFTRTCLGEKFNLSESRAYETLNVSPQGRDRMSPIRGRAKDIISAQQMARWVNEVMPAQGAMWAGCPARPVCACLPAKLLLHPRQYSSPPRATDWWLHFFVIFLKLCFY